MNHKIKALGLALFAVFALSAMAAASASAVTHTLTTGETGEEEVHLTAEAENHQVFEAETGSGEGTTCEKVNVSATVAGPTTEVTVEPNYENCVFFETVEGKTEPISGATVNDNGCHFAFTGETKLGNPTGNEHAEVALKDPLGECEHLEIRATAFQFKCVSIPMNQEVNGVQYKTTINEATGKKNVTIESTVHGLVSTTTESIAGCGEGEHKNGSYTGNVTVQAYSDAKHENPANITF